MSRVIAFVIKSDVDRIAALPAKDRRTFERRIRRLAAYLKNIPRRLYDHHNAYGKKTACKTSACAIGHAHLSGMFKSAGLRGKWETDFWGTSLNVYCVGFSPDSLFSKVEQASNKVFGPGVSDAVFHNTDINTPKQAARALEEFADHFYGKETK